MMLQAYPPNCMHTKDLDEEHNHVQNTSTQGSTLEYKFLTY